MILYVPKLSPAARHARERQIFVKPAETGENFGT